MNCSIEEHHKTVHKKSRHDWNNLNVWLFYSFITRHRVFDLKITQYLVEEVSQRKNIYILKIFQLVSPSVNPFYNTYKYLLYIVYNVLLSDLPFTMLGPSLKYGGISFSKKSYLKCFLWGRLLGKIYKEGYMEGLMIIGGARCIFQ